MRITSLLCGVFMCLLCGCSNSVELAIERYHTASPQVQLGMERDQVLLILTPTQEGLPLRHSKEPEMYYEVVDGQSRFVEIFFFRSQTNYDGILTDDEFTPYVFHDGKLVAVGWTAIGGPKTQAQPIPQQHIQILR